MPQPDGDKIFTAYSDMLDAVKSGMRGVKILKAGAQVIDVGTSGGCLSVIAEAILERMIAAVVKICVGESIDAAAQKLLWWFALTLEYASRTGDLTYLKNKCSQCGQIGHNKQNCIGKPFMDAMERTFGAGAKSALAESSEKLTKNIVEAADDDCSVM